MRAGRVSRLLARITGSSMQPQFTHRVLGILSWTPSLETHQFCISKPPQRLHSMVGPPHSESQFSDTFHEIDVLMRLFWAERGEATDQNGPLQEMLSRKTSEPSTSAESIESYMMALRGLLRTTHSITRTLMMSLPENGREVIVQSIIYRVFHCLAHTWSL